MAVFNTINCYVPKAPLQLFEGQTSGPPEVRWIYNSLRKSPWASLSGQEELTLVQLSFVLPLGCKSHVLLLVKVLCGLPRLASALASWAAMVLIHLELWQNTGVLHPISFVLWTQVDLKCKKAVDQLSFPWFCSFWGITCIKEGSNVVHWFQKGWLFLTWGTEKGISCRGI